MKKIFLLSLIALSITGCGGGTTTSTNPAFTNPPPAAPINSVSLTGLRSDYSILKTASGYSVTDNTGLTQSYGQISQFVFADMRINLGIGDKSQTISPTNLHSLIELYIAYFNRVPDADGLSYWIDQVKAGQTIDQIGQSFYNAAIQYSSLTGYSSTMTNTDFVKIIYKNVLGRDTVDQEGLDYWTKSLASGTATRGTLINTILGSAHGFKGDKTYGWVADLLDNKVKLANLFTIQQGINYLTDEDSISKTMALVAAIKPNNTANAVNLIGKVDWGFREVTNPTFKGAPIPVQSTSYLNAKNLNIPSQSLPMLFRFPIASPNAKATEEYYGKFTQDINGDWGYLNSYGTSYYFGTENAYGFADFFQEGELSLVTVTTEYNPAKPRDVEEKKLGHIFFWKKDATNKWVNNTSLILTENTGCLHARKIAIADFNKDGKPDVFISCTGYDSVPFPGEKSRILLSQPDGKYSNTQVDATANGFSHGASAADVNHDGNIDIVFADASRNSGATPIYFLMGQGDGTFVPDYTRVSKEETAFKPWFTIELIDFDGSGNYSIVAGGHEPFVNKDGQQVSGATTKIIQGNGTGNYLNNFIDIPRVNSFAIALDFLADSGNLYVLRAPMEPFYFGTAVQKVNLKSMTSSLLYQNTGYIDQNNLVWIDWIIPFQDKIVSPAAEFKLSVSK